MTGRQRIAHGGGLDHAIARHGGAQADWLDLSTGINPHAYPVGRIEPQAWTRLPMDGDLQRLLAAARRAYSVPDHADIVATPGAQAAIGWIPRLLPGATATVLTPEVGTYGEFAQCCKTSGRRVRHARGCGDVADDETLVFAARPNNPDGSVIAQAELLALCERMARRGGFVIVDESFCDATPELGLAATAPANLPANLILLRSFGKFFGLAGLRLGFLIAAPAVARSLATALGPWGVSGPAIAVGARALADEARISAMRTRLARESAKLAKVLAGAGLEIVGANPLFVLARHPAAATVGEQLARRHILVRTFDDRPSLIRFGLPPSAAAADRLRRALGEVLGSRQ